MANERPDPDQGVAAGCLRARDLIDKWNPVATSALVVIGECGCRPKTFQFATWVIIGRTIELFGGLDNNNDVAAFLSRLKTKLSPLVPVPYDLRARSIIVPCPPPKPRLEAAEWDKLQAILKDKSKNVDLGTIFSARLAAISHLGEPEGMGAPA
ncbi:MAG TPA: hypothetical protein VNO33_22345 [Kofleriaceae bacterium]|nr:hypothetical protein [Kofleriaceae bacterium]